VAGLGRGWKGMERGGIGRHVREGDGDCDDGCSGCSLYENVCSSNITWRDM
jgi:hypothetical protein